MDGKGAYTNALDLAVDTRTDREAEQKLVPLSFDRTHELNATLTVGRTNNWLASAIGTIRTGTPYTPSLPSSVSPIEYEINSARRPFHKNVDLKVEKFFNPKSVRFSVFLWINNLFDTMNDVLVHTSTGRSLTNLESSTNPNRFNNLEATIRENQEDFFPVEFLDNFYQREDFLSEPREIRLGMTFDF